MNVLEQRDIEFYLLHRIVFLQSFLQHTDFNLVYRRLKHVVEQCLGVM